MGLAFRPPPNTEHVPCWRAHQMPLDSYKDTGCNLMLKIQRPHMAGDPGKSLRNQPIEAVDSPDEVSRTSGFYLKFDAGLIVARRRDDAAHRLLGDAPDPDLFSHLKDPKEIYRRLLMRSFRRGFIVGSGFPTLLSPPQLAGQDDLGGLEKAMQNLRIEPRPLALPWVNFWNGIDANYKTAILKRMDNAAPRISKYLEAAPLGIVAIFGFAGSGKTEMLALTALVQLRCATIGKIYCAVPSHVAVTNFSVRLDRLATEVAKATAGKRTLPMIVRGHSTAAELSAFYELAQNNGKEKPKDPFRSSKWSLKLSACEWLLRVMGFKGFQLKEDDSPAIHRLRERFLREDQYAALRKLAAGEIEFNEVPKYQPPGAEQPRKMVEALIREVINSADAGCTTPHAAGESV